MAATEQPERLFKFGPKLVGTLMDGTRVYSYRQPVEVMPDRIYFKGGSFSTLKKDDFDGNHLVIAFRFKGEIAPQVVII